MQQLRVINKDDYFILYDESGKEIKDTSNVNLSFYKYTIYYYDVKKNILYINKKPLNAKI